MELKCLYCDKKYKSQQSRSNHHRIYHKKPNNSIIQSQPIILQTSIVNSKYNCKNCNAVFTTRQSKSRHILKTCKKQFELKIENEKIEKIKNEKIENEKIENEKIKKKYLELNAKYNELLNIKPTNINIHIHTHNYIYLIEKYDMNINQVLYKIGKSNRPIHMRLKEHGSEAKILLVIDVDNCDTTEYNLLTILNNDINILNRKDIGKEYFSCTDINNPRSYIKNLIIKNID